MATRDDLREVAIEGLRQVERALTMARNNALVSPETIARYEVARERLLTAIERLRDRDRA